MQEFHYAHPKTKIWANYVFNTSFYGSPLWDMSSRDFEKLEKSWNVSHRIMLSIPRTAHRYFIEPLSKRPHIVKSLRNRFINFISKIRMSKKKVLRDMLKEVEDDCRSTTGRNIRNLKLLTQKLCIENINVYKEPYQKIPKNYYWTMEMVNELLSIKSGELRIDNFTVDDLDGILDIVCSS